MSVEEQFDSGEEEVPEGSSSNEIFLTWVQEFFIPTMETAWTDERRWCPQWWLHPEAVDRMHSLWVSHVAAMGAPETLSDWWTRQYDPQILVLTDRKGMFARCSQGHREHERLLTSEFLPPKDYRFPLAYQ